MMRAEPIVEKSIDRLLERTYFTVLRGSEIRPQDSYGAGGRASREIFNLTVALENVRNNVLVSSIRDLNYRFMVAEWLWILFGLEDVATIARFNSKLLDLSDDGVTLAGAYGPRILRQATYVVNTLKRDRSSRQAVLTIWERNPARKKDIPCTLSAQFLIRDDSLHGVFNMRSSDAWIGLPYDAFVFSQMVNYFAFVLEVEPGSLTMNLASSHLYEDHWQKALDFVGSRPDYSQSPVIDDAPPILLKHCLQGVDECGDDPLIESPVWRMYGNAILARTKAEAFHALTEGRS